MADAKKSMKQEAALAPLQKHISAGIRHATHDLTYCERGQTDKGAVHHALAGAHRAIAHGLSGRATPEAAHSEASHWIQQAKEISPHLRTANHDAEVAHAEAGLAHLKPALSKADEGDNRFAGMVEAYHNSFLRR